MKKLLLCVSLLLTLLLLASCETSGVNRLTCDHVDANDSGLCDKCSITFSDGKDVYDKTCQHRDADDNSKCDSCEADYSDGKDINDKNHSCKTLYNYDNFLHWLSCEICGVATSKAEHILDEFGYCTVCDHLSSPTEGISYELSADGSYAKVLGCDSSITNLVIAETYNNAPVKHIAQEAFKGNKNITSLVMPNSIVTIGNFAFYGCENLASITISKSVKDIGERAFSNCGMLEEIYFNAVDMTCLKSMHNRTFTNTGLTGKGITVTIGKNVTRVPAYLFCSNGTLNAQTKVTAITFEDNSVCESIGEWAFIDCNDVTGCLVIPDSVVTIDKGAFYGVGFTSITIGKNVSKIDDIAFSNCYSLVEIINKSNLNFVKGSSNNGSIAQNALEIHSGISKIVNNAGYHFITSGGEHYLVAYQGNDAILDLPESYNGENYKIHNYAFTNCNTCDKLTSVTIPKTVISISESAFAGCDKLVEIINMSGLDITRHALEIHSGERKVMNINEYIFLYHDGINYLVNYVGSDTELYLPNNYNGGNYVIYRTAFQENRRIKGVYIPEGVTKIDNSAFSNCRNLETINIPDSITDIGVRAFFQCTKLPNITIGSGVENIDSYAFENCRSLTSINVSENNYTYKSIAGNLYTKDGTTLIQYAIGKRSDTFVVPNGVTTISSGAFSMCNNIRNIIIPDCVTSIEDSFDFCENLISVIIGSGVTTISPQAFWSCDNLTSVTFKNPIGWSINYTPISHFDLSNPETAARYLSSTHRDSAWHRSDETN